MMATAASTTTTPPFSSSPATAVPTRPTAAISSSSSSCFSSSSPPMPSAAATAAAASPVANPSPQSNTNNNNNNNAPMVLPLSLPTDPQWLTPNLCLLRQQIEVFSVTPADIAARRTGVKPLLGSVGLRCRHCARSDTTGGAAGTGNTEGTSTSTGTGTSAGSAGTGTSTGSISTGTSTMSTMNTGSAGTANKKPRGAVAYPATISQMHQSVRNFHRYHFYSCPNIPSDIKAYMKSFKKKENQSKRNAKEYWIQSCRVSLGLRDVNGEDDGEGGRTKDRQPHIRFRDDWVYTNGGGCSAASGTAVGGGGTTDIAGGNSGSGSRPGAGDGGSTVKHVPTLQVARPAADLGMVEAAAARGPSAEEVSRLSLTDAFEGSIDDIDIGDALDVLLEDGGLLLDRQEQDEKVEAEANAAADGAAAADADAGEGSQVQQQSGDSNQVIHPAVGISEGRQEHGNEGIDIGDALDVLIEDGGLLLDQHQDQDEEVEVGASTAADGGAAAEEALKVHQQSGDSNQVEPEHGNEGPPDHSRRQSSLLSSMASLASALDDLFEDGGFLLDHQDQDEEVEAEANVAVDGTAVDEAAAGEELKVQQQSGDSNQVIHPVVGISEGRPEHGKEGPPDHNRRRSSLLSSMESLASALDDLLEDGGLLLDHQDQDAAAEIGAEANAAADGAADAASDAAADAEEGGSHEVQPSEGSLQVEPEHGNVVSPQYRRRSLLQSSMASLASATGSDMEPRDTLGEHHANRLLEILGTSADLEGKDDSASCRVQRSQDTQRLKSSQITESSSRIAGGGGDRTTDPAPLFDAIDPLPIHMPAANAAAPSAAPEAPTLGTSMATPSSFFDNMPTTSSSVSQSQNKNQNQILDRASHALSLATQICGCHHAGVSIAPFHPPTEPSSSISLESVGDAIERAKSRIQTTRDTTADSVLSGDCIRNDLYLLGRALFLTFTGADPTMVGIGHRQFSVPQAVLPGHEDEDEDDARSNKRERTIKQSQEPSCRSLLQELGIPISFCTLIENLLQVDNDDASQRYRDADELQEDLRYMISKPDVYLFDSGNKSSTGQLVFPRGKLYGRDEEMKTLSSCLDRVFVTSQSREAVLAVLVSGYSGSGKTVLIEQLRAPLAAMSGHFISGKFDQLGQVQPISVIFAAFNDYCKDILEGEEAVLNQIRADILNGLGNHANVLADLIPNLRPLIGDYTSAPSAISGVEQLNRLLYHFRALVRSIASPLHPVILFLDDLQWADSAALEMLSTLLSDGTLSSLLFVGTYRTNEVGPGHPLHITRQSIELGRISILDIQLDDLSKESVNAMISDTLRLLPRLTFNLSDAVHSKTGGNPMFAVQFVRSLYDEGLLKFSAETRRWEWDVDKIMSKDVADNVAALMAAKMRRLHEKMQWMLKVASCFGSRFDASMIALLDNECDEIGTSVLLELAVSEGFLCRISKSGEYKFSHDQIQQAAYSLIPVQEINALHLDIGRKLWATSTKEALERNLVVVVDQMSRGSELIVDHDEKIRFAWLCLKAGEKAMSSSAFPPALMYLLQGSVMLKEDDWETNYELSLRTFCGCAEAQYVAGNHEMAMISLSHIFEHGKCFGDQLGAYCTLLLSLASQGKLQEAIAKSLDLLSELGEEIPSDPTQADVIEEVGVAHAMLSETSAAQILAMDEMVDADKLASMKLFYSLTYHTFQGNQELLSVIISRMIQMSLKHGLCKETALAFAGFASFSSAFGRYEEARGFGRLSTALLERFGDDRYYHLVHLVLNWGVYVYIEPLQLILPRLKTWQEKGMSAGEVISAWSNANIYVLKSLECGSRLDRLVDEIKNFIQELKETKFQYLLDITLPPFQAALNLMGECDDPTQLSGSAMNQDELLKLARETSQFNVESLIIFYRMWLAYLFGKYELAAEMAERRREISKNRPMRAGTHVSESFYTGLIATIMAYSSEPGGEWRSLVSESIEQFRGWTAASEWNFLHKLRLLEAEAAYYLNGDIDGASEAYRDAIRLAGEHGYLGDQALACERAGIFYAEKFGLPAALGHFQNAHKYYLDFGATKKAFDVLERHLGE